MSVRLESSDKKIILVHQDVIKQMVTIQTMLESLGIGDNDTNKDEIVPIFTVNEEILEKVIEWTKYYIENTDKCDHKVWSNQFFKTKIIFSIWRRFSS